MDSIFKALADPSRRDLLDALRREDGQTLSELEAALPISRFGVAKHLKALEAAGLVTRVRRGRFTHHYLNPVPIAEALARWIEPYRVAPAVRGVLDLKARLEMPVTDKPDFVLSTYIRCSQDSLWDALNDPAAVERYDPFGQRATQEGDAVVHRLPDGTVTLRTRVVEAVPKTRLVTTFEPLWDADVPASRVTYEIVPEGTFCKLTVTHADLPRDGRDEIADGWERGLAGLKTWLETGEPMAFAGEMEA